MAPPSPAPTWEFQSDNFDFYILVSWEDQQQQFHHKNKENNFSRQSGVRLQPFLCGKSVNIKLTGQRWGNPASTEDWGEDWHVL